MRRRLVLIAILALCAIPASRVPLAVAVEEADLLWHVGASAFNDKLYTTAADVLRQFVERFPDDKRVGEAWLLLGKTYFAQDQHEPALDAFRRAATVSPPPGRSQEAKFWEGEALFRLKRPAEARSAYDHVVRTDAASPLAPEAMYGLAWSELELKRTDAAVAAFRELLDVPAWVSNPLVPQATFTLARTLADLSRWNEVEPLLAPFATRYPAHRHAGDAQYLLGLTRIALGKTKQGITDLRTFIAAYPGHELVGAARQQITEAVRKSGDRSELTAEYQALMTEPSTSAERLYAAGQFAAEAGDAAQQEAAWQRLRKEFPDDPLAREAALALATAAFERGEYEESKTLAADAGQRVDLAGRAHLLRGEAELRLKQHAEALEAFHAALVAPGLDAAQRLQALAGSATAREERQEWAAALQLYAEIAAGGDPKLAEWARDATLALGRARQDQGDHAVALDAFRQAQRYKPPPGRSQEARYFEADTLLRLKRYAEARAAYAAVVRADPDSPFTPDAVYGMAWLDLEQKRLNLATRSLKLLVEKWADHPLAPEAAFTLARTLVEMKRHGEVVPVLADFLEKHPTNERAPDALYMLGLARLQTGDTAAGIADLRNFVTGNPAHDLAGAARARITESVLGLGDPGELGREYEELIDAPAPTAESLHTAGTIAKRLGREPEQEAAWERLRREFPGHELAQQAAWELARTAFDRGQYRDAAQLAREAVGSEALQAEAYLLIGDAHLKLGQRGDALPAFAAAIAVPGVNPGLKARARAGSATAAEEDGRWAEALDLYETVAAESPDAALAQWARDAVLALAKTRLAQGDLDTAVDAFRRTGQLTPPPGRSQEARFWEGEALMRLKRHAEARAAWEAVVRADRDSPFAPDALYGLAWLDLDQKRLGPAIVTLQQFVERWPEHERTPDAMFELARTFVDVQRYPEAVRALAAFTERHPTHQHVADARYLLGWTRIQTGQSAEAIADLRAFVRSNPSHPSVAEARRMITVAVQKLGDRNELAVEYQALMDGSPTPDGLHDAALIASQLGRAEDQEAAWRRLRREFPDHALARRAAFELANLAFTRGRYEEAASLAAEAARVDDFKPSAYLLIGESELRLKRYPAALSAFGTAASVPHVDRALRTRALAGSALAHEEQQRYPDALKLYQMVAVESPDATLKDWSKERIAAINVVQRRAAQRSTLDQAQGLLGQKRYGEAIAQARSLTQSEEAGVRFESYLLIGEAELERRRYPEALAAFEAASAVPDIDGALRHQAVAGMGRALEEQRRWPEALQRYEEVATSTADPELRRWAEERADEVRAKQKPPPRRPQRRPGNRS